MNGCNYISMCVVLSVRKALSTNSKCEFFIPKYVSNAADVCFCDERQGAESYIEYFNQDRLSELANAYYAEDNHNKGMVVLEWFSGEYSCYSCSSQVLANRRVHFLKRATLPTERLKCDDEYNKERLIQRLENVLRLSSELDGLFQSYFEKVMRLLTQCDIDGDYEWIEADIPQRNVLEACVLIDNMFGGADTWLDYPLILAKKRGIEERFADVSFKLLDESKNHLMSVVNHSYTNEYKGYLI